MFTWKGIKDSAMGINALPYSRTLTPAQRVIQTYIQGRDGTYNWTDGTYDNGMISIPCIYFGSTAPETIRQVAGWLTGSGPLIFDDEPDKYYQAYIYDAQEVERNLYEDSFTLSFIVFPFALGAPQTVSQDLTYSGEAITINVEGTANTPCVITYRNTGAQVINTITVTQTI